MENQTNQTNTHTYTGKTWKSGQTLVITIPKIAQQLQNITTGTIIQYTLTNIKNTKPTKTKKQNTTKQQTNHKPNITIK